MVYEPDFLAPAEETALLDTVRGLPLEDARYKQYTAKRRVASYGSSYDYEANQRTPAPPFPSFLQPLREKAAAWAGMRPEDFVHALVAEYRPGTQLGWHRDVPDFEVIVGVSLGTAGRMRFRPYPAVVTSRKSPVTRPAPFELLLEPRSIYRLSGPSRWNWQHSIPPTKALRYSITLRTLSARGRRPARGT
jgi:alkylated DNA repair dioxygenase AlkB